MALPSSGVISASDINTELGVASTATLSLNSTEARDLAGVPAGAISFDDFHGKSSLHIREYTGQNGKNHFYGDCDFGPDYANRRVFVAIFTADGVGSANITDIVIGGLNASGHDAGYQDGTGNRAGAGVFAANPTGTTGEVSFEMVNDAESHIVVVALNAPSATMFDNDASRNDSNPGGAVAVDIDTDGVLFGVYNSSSSLNRTLSGVTRQIYGLFKGNRYIVGFDTGLSAESARAVSVSTASGDAYVFLGVSFT